MGGTFDVLDRIQHVYDSFGPLWAHLGSTTWPQPCCWSPVMEQQHKDYKTLQRRAEVLDLHTQANEKGNTMIK